jgi:hypothetical protein
MDNCEIEVNHSASFIFIAGHFVFLHNAILFFSFRKCCERICQTSGSWKENSIAVGAAFIKAG